jgi:hypothetical protein
MAGGDDNEDAQVRRWIEESKGLYANVANEAWLEWGQDILPHLAKNSKDHGETKESLVEEERRRVEELDDAFANGPMSFEDREAGLKALRRRGFQKMMCVDTYEDLKQSVSTIEREPESVPETTQHPKHNP